MVEMNIMQPDHCTEAGDNVTSHLGRLYHSFPELLPLVTYCTNGQPKPAVWICI